MSSTRKTIHAFFILACTTAGCMFCYKLFAFLKTIKKDELAGFAFDPIMIYAFVAMGFLCLLAWAFMSGQFRDIEGPKYEMFDRFAEQERAERNAEGDPMSGQPELDREAFKPGFGTGGVPWYLMLLYLSFLVFFTWYVLEYQLTDYLELQAEKDAAAVTAPPGD